MIEMDMPKLEVLENDDSYAKIVCEPLEKGFGLTIGNCLRRILAFRSARRGCGRDQISGRQREARVFRCGRRQGGRDGDHPQPQDACDKDEGRR